MHEKRMEGWLPALSLFLLLSSHQNPHNTMLAGVEGPPTG
jgi:ATP/maltotriose-dependent transcriptional regulator MalT